MESLRHIVPKVQPDEDDGGIPTQRRKPAAGGGGSQGGGGLLAGQNVVCKISHVEPDGYAVLIPKYSSRGFLPTGLKLKPGEEIFAIFVCFSNSRMLLSTRVIAPDSGGR